MMFKKKYSLFKIIGKIKIRNVKSTPRVNWREEKKKGIREIIKGIRR